MTLPSLQDSHIDGDDAYCVSREVTTVPLPFGAEKVVTPGFHSRLIPLPHLDVQRVRGYEKKTSFQKALRAFLKLVPIFFISPNSLDVEVWEGDQSAMKPGIDYLFCPEG